ncbi:MAG: SRPBCC family protein [Flavobacteriales bacterium]|nr:SRPBCC family protein [Bacteroidota bacterium]MCB9240529.1 SRPBCC family protein [Flavobacteriales bacterium]
MAFYQFKRTQRIPTDRKILWDFISSPRNLSKITPSDMGFLIRSEVPEVMYPGMMVEYTVKPLLGISTTWVTEITHVQEGHYFVDEQRIGPYAIWHHEHHIEEVDGGMLMTDIISYAPPFGFLGRLANALIIRRKLTQIFDYREKVLKEVFG